MVLFLFDECIAPQIPRALNIVTYQAHAVEDVRALGRGADDQQVVEWCKDERAVLVTADLRMRRPSGYRDLIRRTGVSVAFFKPRKGGWSLKEWFREVVRQTGHLEEKFSGRRPVYWQYSTGGRKRRITL